MAILKVFSLYDARAEFYMPPFMAPTVPMAVRVIIDECRTDNLLSRHPNDFELQQIAEWDDHTGSYMPLPNFYRIGVVSTLLPAPQPSLDVNNPQMRVSGGTH